MTELGALPRRCGQRSRAEGVEKTGSMMGTSTAPEAQRTRLPLRLECRGGSRSAWPWKLSWMNRSSKWPLKYGRAERQSWDGVRRGGKHRARLPQLWWRECGGRGKEALRRNQSQAVVDR